MRGRTDAIRVGGLWIFAATLVFLSGAVCGCMSAEERVEPALKIARVELAGLNARGVGAGEYFWGERGEWEKFWRKQGRGPAPEIDFEEYSLVAVFLGQRPNPGYSVGIVDAKESAGEVVVEVIEYMPAPCMMYAQVIVYPFDAALIPRTENPIRFATAKKSGRP